LNFEISIENTDPIDPAAPIIKILLFKNFFFISSICCLFNLNLSLLDIQPIPFSLEDAFIGEVQRAGGAPL
jgi:hypothetical protein